MKIIFACLLLVAAVQARDWYKVKHVQRTVEAKGTPLNGRIIGGEIASPGQFPYQVGLWIDGSGFCGGSLISDSVVLTAAHCADGASFHDVVCGAQNIYNEGEAGRVTVTTTNSQMHENYNGFTLENDLALVKLTEPVSGPNIGTLRLPSRSMVGNTYEGSPARSSGWGRVSDSNPNISEELKFVDVTIMSNQQCAGVYGSTITDCHVCIDTAGGTGGVCNGDSGGPLTIDEGDGERTIVGITSFVASLGCASGLPHGYCRVTCYLDWIEQNAGVQIRP